MTRIQNGSLKLNLGNTVLFKFMRITVYCKVEVNNTISHVFFVSKDCRMGLTGVNWKISVSRVFSDIRSMYQYVIV